MIDTRQRGKARFFLARWAGAIVLFALLSTANSIEAKADVWQWLTDLLAEDSDVPPDLQEVSALDLPPNAIVTAPGEVRTIDLGHDLIELYPVSAITVEPSSGHVVHVRLISGTIRAKVAERKTRSFKVETVYLVATVKGTVFEVSTNRAASAVSVYEGRVGVTATAGTGGVDVTPSKTGTVGAHDDDVKLDKTPTGGAAAAAEAAGQTSSAAATAPNNVPSNDDDGEASVIQEMNTAGRGSSGNSRKDSGRGGEGGEGGGGGEGGEGGGGDDD